MSFGNSLLKGATKAGTDMVNGASKAGQRALGFGKDIGHKALNFGKQVAHGASHVGHRVLKTGEHALSTVAGLPKKAASHLYHGAEHLGKKAFKGAGHLAQAALHQGEPLWKGALKQGQKLFKGAVDYADHHKNQVALAAAAVSPALGAALSPDARKFTEAIPGWIDKHVDQLTKGRAQMMKALVKPLEHIPVVGKAAQAYAWFDNKVGEFGGGILKGAGSMVGGVLNMVTHPVETATGLYAMAEHVPVMNGLMPNPLKLAHAGADIIFNGADPKTRLETVIDPVKSLQDDGKFGKALVKGFIEPYKKSWSEGKYFEVAGRATFDIGSLFIGAGEANAAIKTGEVASVAGKTAEVANVAGKAGEVANVASKTGKGAEVASTAGKANEIAEAAGKTGKASKVANITDKVADTGKGAKTSTEAVEGVDKAADGAKASKNVDFAEGNWDGKRRRGVGNLEGRRLSRRELNSLEHELKENGLNLNRKADKVIRQQGGTEKARAAFDYESGTVLLRNGATHFEAFHEMTHARQFIEIGQEAYIKLGRFEREAHVFNTIWKNRRLFNKSEMEASIESKYRTKIEVIRKSHPH
jgi:Metallopeptidase toxin 4